MEDDSFYAKVDAKALIVVFVEFDTTMAFRSKSLTYRSVLVRTSNNSIEDDVDS